MLSSFPHTFLHVSPIVSSVSLGISHTSPNVNNNLMIIWMKIDKLEWEVPVVKEALNELVVCLKILLSTLPKLGD